MGIGTGWGPKNTNKLVSVVTRATQDKLGKKPIYGHMFGRHNQTAFHLSCPN